MKNENSSQHLVDTIERLRNLPDDGYDGNTLYNNSIEYFLNDSGKIVVESIIDAVETHLHPIKINSVLHFYDRAKGIFTHKNLGGLISRDITGRGKVGTTVTNEVIDRFARDIMHDTPVSRGYIVFRNGILNLSTGVLEPRKYVKDRILVTYYDFNFTSEGGEVKVLRDIANNDDEILRSLYSLIGVTLFGKNIDQRAYILLGSGSNGKSTFLNMLRKILGEENYSSVSLSEIGDRFRTAEMYNKRANLSGDLEATTIKHTSYFKNITGQDTVIAERKYLDPFSFTYDGIPIFAMNDYPYFEETGDQIARRLAVIPFLNRFERTEDNRELFTEKDLENIIFNSYRAFVEFGGHVYIPERVDEMNSEYKEAINPIGAFIFYKGGAEGIIGEKIGDCFEEFVEFLYMMDYDEKYVKMFTKRKFSDKVKAETGLTVKVKRIGKETPRIFCRGD